MQKYKADQEFEFSSTIAGIKNEGVDKEARVIRGFAVITKGEAKTHLAQVDGTTLDQVVALGKQFSVGLKSRFGHPKLEIEDPIGTYLGEVKNFRHDGNVVRADLHIDPVADLSPKYPGMGTYVLEFADKSPEKFGASIVFFGRAEQMGGQAFIRVRELSACDVTDTPAANPTGMFSVKPMAAEGKGLSQMADVKCPKCGETFEIEGEKKEQGVKGGGAIALTVTAVGSFLVSLSQDEAQKTILASRPDVVEAFKALGREEERKYRIDFSTVVSTANLSAEEAKSFEKYYGRKIDDVKEFATLVAGKRATALGEGGDKPVDVPEGDKKTPADPAVAAATEFKAQPDLRRAFGYSGPTDGDKYKAAEDRYVKAMVPKK